MAKESMRDRIKQIAASSGTAASMVPTPKEELPPPPEKVVEVVPDIADLVQDRKARLEIARLAAQYGELGETKSTLQKQQDLLSKRLKQLLGTYKVGKALAGEWRMNYYSVPRSSIKKDKLLEVGVSPAQIAAATETTQAYTLRISRADQEEEEWGK